MTSHQQSLSEMTMQECKAYIDRKIPDIGEEVKKRYMTYLIGRSSRVFDDQGELRWNAWVEAYNKSLNEGISPENMKYYTKRILNDVYNKYILKYVSQFENDPLRQHIEAYDLLKFFSSQWGLVEEPLDAEFPAGLQKPQKEVV